MPKVVKRKRKLGAGRFTGTGAAKVTSPLRPRFVEKTQPCTTKCPNGTRVRDFIMKIQLAEKYDYPYEQAFKEAWEILIEKNPLPAVCGRVCPHPCEDDCNRQQKEGAVGINNLERFVGDYALEQGFEFAKPAEKRSEKIAIVGSGPAGLSCAYQLALQGYPVTIYEAFPKPGGMLRYGIPAYRLPREVIDGEINRILGLGVELKTDTAVGRDVPYEDLKQECRAIFVAIGAHQGKLLGVEGEDVSNVFTGTDFLNRVNSGEKMDLGKKVLVIGGGDTAVDAARVARRLGAEATIVYRRTIAEMPAIKEEIEGAKSDGVDIQFLAAPVGFISDGGRATAMKCIRMELGEPDSSGRRRPVPLEGSEFTVEADTIVSAISQEPDFSGLEHLREGRDWVKADEDGRTKEEKTFAGGDVLDLALVTTAIFHGRRAAAAIHSTITGEPLEKPASLPPITHDKMRLDLYEERKRQEQEVLAPEEALKGLEIEVNRGLSREQAIEEAKRCLSCVSCFDCGNCWSYCQDQAVIKPVKPGEPYRFKMEFCQGCKKCAEECPCGFIEMV